ncbi:hypothetical protein L7F22_012326 [Adiantum nelumboides]|nr:hypothetical protein [Adiantum nelumboides]
MGKEQTEALGEEVDKLLKAGFICPVKTAEWVSPVVVTPKKDGRWRVCVDFKPLNAATKKDPYPLSFIDQILDSVAGHERYSVCDGFVKEFIDDFCVYSTRAEHCEKLEMVLKHYDECGGQLNPKKCSFAQPRVKLLGHMLSENGIEADPDKVKAMILLPSPKDSKQVATFVHKVKYMARFIPLVSQVLYPLQQAVKQDPLVWNEECEAVFQNVKEILGGLPAMQALDWEQVFYVNPSVGEDAIGAMLLQKGKKSKYMRPVYCAMKKWVIELQEFEFSFLVEESTRATLADLLTYKESPLLIKEEVIKKVEEDVKELTNAHILFSDGSYRKSHDAASGGIALYDPEGKLVCKKRFKLNAHSNNEAEYATLEAGLHICLKHGVKRLCIRGDALLVVKQVLGVWKTKNSSLREICFKIKSLLKRFEANTSSELQQSLDYSGMHQVIDEEDFDDTVEDLDGAADYLSDRREEKEERPTDEMLAEYFLNGLRKELKNAIVGVDIAGGLQALVETVQWVEKRFRVSHGKASKRSSNDKRKIMSKRKK